MTVASDDERRAATLDALESHSDAAGEQAVRTLLAVQVDGEVVRGQATLWRREPRPGELHRPPGRDPSPLRGLRAQRELPFADQEQSREGAKRHVRQVHVDVDRSTLGQTDDGARDEGINLVAHPRALGGEGDEARGEPLEQPREVDVALSMAHDRVPGVGHLDGRFDGRSSVARLGMVDRDLGPLRGRVESKVGFGVEPMIAGNARGERLLDHAQIKSCGQRRRGRVHHDPEPCPSDGLRGTLARTRERQLEGTCGRAESPVHAPASRCRLCRARAQHARKATQLRALGHLLVLRSDEGERDAIDVELTDRGRGSEEPRGLARQRHSSARRGAGAGRRESIEGRSSVFVDDHRQRAVRHRHSPDQGSANPQEWPQRPAHVHATDANEIRARTDGPPSGIARPAPRLPRPRAIRPARCDSRAQRRPMCAPAPEAGA